MDTDDLTLLTQSRFYSPALNAAIFDGPIRIYFDQNQESGALKLYFTLLNAYKSLCGGLQSERLSTETSVFIMIYPSPELFHMICPADIETHLVVDQLGKDYVIAVDGLPDESLLADLVSQVQQLTPVLPEMHPTPI